MLSVPHLHLTHGQVAWTICEGRSPDPRTTDALRYLRQLGVPFTEDEVGVGRGHRLTYSFDHLVECALAMWAIRRGSKPRTAAGFVTAERTALRKLFHQHFRAMPDAALTAEWVKSRGRIHATDLDEQFIRLHSRHAERGEIETMTMDQVLSYKASFGDMVERYDNEVHILVPVRRVMLEAVAWSLVAPVTPPGRVAKKKEGAAVP